MSNDVAEDVTSNLQTLSLQETPAAQPEKKEQQQTSTRPRGQARRNNNNNREEKGRQGRAAAANGHEYQGWNGQDFVRIADGRGAPMGYHYSVEQQDQYAMYANPYEYAQPVQGYERSVRVMQAYPPQYPYEMYDNQGQWSAPYYNPMYYQQPQQQQPDMTERRAEQIGEGEGFGDSCPCCAGNPENCQAQQCAERGFCGCLFGAMDADVVDDTWKDEWFAASRTCGCCEGYIYRCKAQDDACSSGTCVCSHTKTVVEVVEAVGT